MSAVVASPGRPQVSPRVALLVTLTAGGAAILLTAASTSLAAAVDRHPAEVVEFVVLSLVLQLFSVRVFETGSLGVSPVGLIAVGIALGPGAAVFAGALAGVVRLVASRGIAHRGIFDSAQWALSAGAATGAYAGVAATTSGTAGDVAASVAAGIAYTLVNNGLLCSAIGLDEGERPLHVWNTRFRWARYHYLTFGPLAYAAVSGYHAIGLLGLVAFSLPPGLLMLTFRQYMERTKEALDKERRAKRRVDEQTRNLADLYSFTRGLSERAHDREALVAFAEQELARLFGPRTVTLGAPDAPGLQLTDGNKVVATLAIEEGPDFDRKRWERLNVGIVLQLAPALDRAALAERVKQSHLETIAALSRSMEAKDTYTGGHTERVADIAVALGRRLGFTGENLDALQIGALLHDIGKIGIPESILTKAGPLDEAEWKLMVQHPVISEHIVADLPLSPIVRQVARWSHERVDGAGYPDQLAGEAIPLASRIVFVADAFDALPSDRSYRPARSAAAALEEIRQNSGTQFCHQVVAALEQLYKEEPALVGAPALRVVEAA